MAEEDLLHTAQLLKTALPYVDVRSRLTLDLLVKLYELIICMRNYTTNDISACGFESEKADMEALLNNIRPKCNNDEQAFVDKILNIFQAKKMFEMYNSYMEAMNTMQGFDGFSGGNTDGEDASDGFTNSFKDFDFSSIFGDDFDPESFLQSYKSMSSDNNEHSEYPYESEEVVVSKSPPDSKAANEALDDNDMFESLKSMISPDQMQTFENLRMLFGATSYDDSNKPSENKE